MCNDADVANRCTLEQLYNSYDNTILYVDHVLGGIVRTLDRSRRALRIHLPVGSRRVADGRGADVPRMPPGIVAAAGAGAGAADREGVRADLDRGTPGIHAAGHLRHRPRSASRSDAAVRHERKLHQEGRPASRRRPGHSHPRMQPDEPSARGVGGRAPKWGAGFQAGPSSSEVGKSPLASPLQSLPSYSNSSGPGLRINPRADCCSTC